MKEKRFMEQAFVKSEFLRKTLRFGGNHLVNRFSTQLKGDKIRLIKIPILCITCSTNSYFVSLISDYGKRIDHRRRRGHL